MGSRNKTYLMDNIPNLRLEDLAYAAGIIDGEGSLSMGKTHGYVSMELCVAVTDRGLLEWFVARFGGSSTSWHKANSTNRRVYYWSIRQARALHPFLTAIRPYLVIKGPQADVMLAFCDLVLRTRRPRLNEPLDRDQVAERR